MKTVKSWSNDAHLSHVVSLSRFKEASVSLAPWFLTSKEKSSDSASI